MLSFNDKISIRQFQILIILEVFGTGVIMAPRRGAEYAGQDGWIVILIATAIALVLTFIMASLGRMFPGQSFTSYTGKIVTRPLAMLVSLGFCVLLVFRAALELRLFGEIVKQIMLFDTPFWVICFSMLAISGFAAAKGYETRARLAEILIIIVFIPLIVVFAIAAKDVDFTNIMPVLVTPRNELIRGGVFNTVSFMGIEMILLAAPYLVSTKNMRRGAMVSVLIVGLSMTAVTILAIAQFGYFDITRQMWPVLELMDTIVLPGSFIERQEALIMSFWIISVFAIVNACLFFSSVLIKDSVKKGRHSWYICLCGLLIFFLSFVPKDIQETMEFMNALFLTLGVGYAFVIPLILLVVAKIRKVGEANVEVAGQK